MDSITGSCFASGWGSCRTSAPSVGGDSGCGAAADSADVSFAPDSGGAAEPRTEPEVSSTHTWARGGVMGGTSDLPRGVHPCRDRYLGW